MSPSNARAVPAQNSGGILPTTTKQFSRLFIWTVIIFGFLVPAILHLRGQREWMHICWSIGAIIVSVVVTRKSYRRFWNELRFAAENKDSWVIDWALYYIPILLIVAGLVLFAHCKYPCLTYWGELMHTALMLCVSIAWIKLDKRLAELSLALSSASNETAEKQRAALDSYIRLNQTIRVLDWPVTVCIAVILFWQLIFTVLKPDSAASLFTSGALAFQFLICNAVFVVISDVRQSPCDKHCSQLVNLSIVKGAIRA